MATGQIKPDMVYEDENLLAFRDINPQAPVHILIIPKVHVATLNELNDPVLAGQLLQAAAKVAKQEGLAENGYRTVINCNTHGGQEVYHLHLHVLGGRQMRWPPG
jgi:histidine triad (HIT) family protein